MKYRYAMWMVIALSVMALAAGRALAESHKSTPEQRRSVSITIYNDNLGLVKEVRAIEIPRGSVDLRFEGVAAQIDPTSVHIRSLNHPADLAVLEQNFEYDLISPEKLMEKYLGRMVELARVLNNEEVITPARLIGNQDGYVYEIDGKIAVNPPGRVILPEIPEGLIAKPTLVWLLENGRESHEIEASYLTGGIGWRANYVTVLDDEDKRIDLSGWVTIDNRSGATYQDASLKLVAGDVHRVAQEPVRKPRAEVMLSASAPAQFAEEAFFEYHLYTLQRKSTIKDNQTKQISLLDAEGIGVNKRYVYQPAQPTWHYAMNNVEETKVGVLLEFDNSERNHLGMPLPKGLVRVYKKDKDGALQFVGEDRIDHTPEDETVRIKMGEAFDIVAERAQTDFKTLERGRVFESSYRVVLRNHKEEDITVAVIELIPGDWRILESSEEFTKETSNRVRFDVPVAKKGQSELTYTVRVKY